MKKGYLSLTVAKLPELRCIQHCATYPVVFSTERQNKIRVHCKCQSVPILEDRVKSSVWYSLHNNPPAVLSKREMRTTNRETEEYIDHRAEVTVKFWPILYHLGSPDYLPQGKHILMKSSYSVWVVLTPFVAYWRNCFDLGIFYCCFCIFKTLKLTLKVVFL